MSRRRVGVVSDQPLVGEAVRTALGGSGLAAWTIRWPGVSGQRLAALDGFYDVVVLLAEAGSVRSVGSILAQVGIERRRCVVLTTACVDSVELPESLWGVGAVLPASATLKRLVEVIDAVAA